MWAFTLWAVPCALCTQHICDWFSFIAIWLSAVGTIALQSKWHHHWLWRSYRASGCVATWSSVLLLCVYIGRMGVLFCYCILLPPLRLEFTEKDGFLELYNISFPHLDHSPSLPYNFKKQSNSQNASSRSKTFSSNREPLRPWWQTPQVPS